jgi:hypothetical protein
MKTLLFCSILLLVSIPCSATTYTWNNGSGDHNFINVANWTPSATEFLDADIFYVEKAGSDYAEIASKAIGYRVYVAYGSTTGELRVTGGVSNFGYSFLAGRVAASKGYVYVSGGEITFLNSFCTIGESGYGYLQMDGGIVRGNRMNLGTKTNAESFGQVIMNDGLIDMTTTLACATNGKGDLVVNGGKINVGTTLSVGGSGKALLTFNGNAGDIECGQLAINNLSAIRMNLDGTAVFGSPITITTTDSSLVGDFDPNFIPGTERRGLYVAAAALNNIISTTEPNLTTIDSYEEGWRDQIINVGAGTAVMLMHPHSGNTVNWTNGGSGQYWSTPGNWNTSLDADDLAVIDLAGTAGSLLNSTGTCSGLVVGSATSGSLDLATGAIASFGTVVIGDSLASSGRLTITDGIMTVASTAMAGVNGDASLIINGGRFYAGNVIAALNTESSADIQIANNAVVDIDGLVGLNNAAKLTLTGHQTNVQFGTLTAAQGSELGFVLNGALGVGNGLVVNGDVVLAGAVQPGFVGGVKADGTYTLLRSSGTITDKTGGTLVKSIPGSIVSYAIETEGTDQVLKMTVYSPTTCQEVINAGLRYSADLNKDCHVNLTDFAEMASQWLFCNDPQGGANCSL